VNLVKNNAFLSGLAFGGFVAAQVAQPIGAILDIGLILLGGVQTGLSFGSFLYKSATSENQTDILQASREFVNTFTNLAGTIAAPAGLLKLEISGGAGLANATKFLDGARRLWQEIDSLSRIRRGSLTVSDGLSAIFRVFSDDTTPVGRLLQYGSEGVKSFLGNSIAKLTTNISIQGLKEFADRFKIVASISEKIESSSAFSNALKTSPKAVQNILEYGVESINILNQRISLGEDIGRWIQRISEISVNDARELLSLTQKALDIRNKSGQIRKTSNVGFLVKNTEISLPNSRKLVLRADDLIGVSSGPRRTPQGTLTIRSEDQRIFTDLSSRPDGKFDSEVKILEEIAHQIKSSGIPESDYGLASGTIRIFTERLRCDLCKDIIENQWTKLFKNIKIEIVEGPNLRITDLSDF
jgi:The  BURPS668_1122 family of deaminases